jgi:hypothetical protein
VTNQGKNIRFIVQIPKESMSNDPLSVLISLLTGNIDSNPEDWKSRKEYARLLYDQGKTKEAAEVIWGAPFIPSIDLEIGFAAKILAKGAPKRAIRLLAHLQELNDGKPVQNMAIANALLHHGMVMQAARFYGAAMQVDPTLTNPNLEHFLLWVDDSEKLWGDFAEKPKVFSELPWIKRSTEEEAARLEAFKAGHTTPIKIPGLAAAPGEVGSNPMYTQDPRRDRPVTPPPAVTIPMDRVEERHMIIDNQNGANTGYNQAAESDPNNGSTFGVPLPVAQGGTPAPVAQPAPTGPPTGQLIRPPTGAPTVPLAYPSTALPPVEPAKLAPERKPRLLTPPPTQFITRGSKIIRSSPPIDPREGGPVKIKKPQ